MCEDGGVKLNKNDRRRGEGDRRLISSPRYYYDLLF